MAQKSSRSSKTGKFVSAKFAKKHKATTQSETIEGRIVTIAQVKQALANLLKRL